MASGIMDAFKGMMEQAGGGGEAGGAEGAGEEGGQQDPNQELSQQAMEILQTKMKGGGGGKETAEQEKQLGETYKKAGGPENKELKPETHMLVNVALGGAGQGAPQGQKKAS